MPEDWSQYARKAETAPADEWAKYARTPEPKTDGGGKSLLGFGGNVVTSGANFVGDLTHAVTHPIDTAAGVVKAAVGTVDSAVGGTGTAESNALWDHLKGRYGSFEKTKETMYNDPVGFLSDLSTVAGGVGAVGDAAKAGKVASVANKVAEITNPVGLAGKIVAPAVTPVADATKQLLAKGALKGGFQVNTDAAHLGQEVTNAADAMVSNGISFSEKGVQDLKQALGGLQKQKEQLAMDATQQRGGVVDRNLVLKNLHDLRRKWETQAYPVDDLKQIDAVIQDFETRHSRYIGLDEAEALKEGTYANNRYGGGVPPPHLAATAASEQNIAHTLMDELRRQIPELSGLNAKQAEQLQLEPMLMTALTKYRNSGGFLPNMWKNLTSVRGGVVDAMASGLGFGLSHSPETAGIAGASAAVLQALLADPQVKTRLAMAIDWAQKSKPVSAAAPANALRTINAYSEGFGKQQEQK